ncbi:M23 family metallopeptidase [Paenibacillus allorhizosphaerae]|nr:M23 family metallopeptidase [Paenibacillus allorhizosphaerae]
MKHKVLLGGALLLGVCAGIFIYEQRTPAEEQGDGRIVAEKKSPVRREMTEFRMKDFDRGWIRYADGGTLVTEDGGLTWREGAVPESEEASVEPAVWSGMLPEERKPDTVVFQSREYPVKQSQFMTDRLGWVLLPHSAELKHSVLVTTDGGNTWYNEVTPSIRTAMQEEKKRQQQIKDEAARYASEGNAKLAIGSQWTLLPDTVSPGDVVLVRHSGPGEVSWQGKTFPLEPSGAGYFTYVPVSMQVKPGSYAIGDQTLTVKAKKFETQYLQVTKQMEAMKQDTQRIQADQKAIDAARSKSEPEFLFSEAFIQPIEGILTTPYGYTRYVNGKLDSTHTALDLAAKQGTPIKATNDGVVALADSLYLTGNSIYIDHGMGLFSQYAHLFELHVKAGDRVKKGDIIGTVGTTGFSTGPHLHFTFWAHNTPVNPNLFFNTTPFHWLRKET